MNPKWGIYFPDSVTNGAGGVNSYNWCKPLPERRNKSRLDSTLQEANLIRMPLLILVDLQIECG